TNGSFPQKQQQQTQEHRQEQRQHQHQRRFPEIEEAGEGEGEEPQQQQQRHRSHAHSNRHNRHNHHKPAVASTTNTATTTAPVVLLHGVGLGLLPYMDLIRRLLAAGLPVLLVEYKHVSLRLCSIIPSADDIAGVVVGLLDRLGVAQACVVAQSYGTFVASRLAQCHAARLQSLVMLDPVCFGMFLPHLLANFIYRKPRTTSLRTWIVDQALSFMSRDLHCAAAMCRRFYWSDLNLWPQDLPFRTLVAIAGQDQLIHVEAVMEFVRHYASKVLFHPQHTHAQLLVDSDWEQQIVADILSMASSGGGAAGAREVRRRLATPATPMSLLPPSSSLPLLQHRMRQRTDGGMVPVMTAAAAAAAKSPPPPVRPGVVRRRWTTTGAAGAGGSLAEEVSEAEAAIIRAAAAMAAPGVEATPTVGGLLEDEETLPPGPQGLTALAEALRAGIAKREGEEVPAAAAGTAGSLKAGMMAPAGPTEAAAAATLPLGAAGGGAAVGPPSPVVQRRLSGTTRLEACAKPWPGPLDRCHLELASAGLNKAMLIAGNGSGEGGGSSASGD
ncbi:hypothetical protein Agub_g3690, partial [Astrephomene gubernaculifera]